MLSGSCLRIKHPITQCPTFVYPSNDGFLHEGSPTGPCIPPFRSRGDIDHKIPLNAIFVNFTASVRLRHLDCQKPGWRSTLHQEAKEVLAEVEQLHEAVLWDYRKSVEALDQAPVGIQ